MSQFKKLIKYTEVVLDDFSISREIISYCIPIKVNRFENGLIQSFEIEKILDVAAFIKGSDNVLKRKSIFSPNNVPEEIRTRMSAIDQGMRDY